MPGTPAFNMKSKRPRNDYIQFKKRNLKRPGMRYPKLKLTIVKLWSKIRVVPPKRNLVLRNAVVDDDPQVGLISANPVFHWPSPVGPIELCLVCQAASLDTKPEKFTSVKHFFKSSA